MVDINKAAEVGIIQQAPRTEICKRTYGLHSVLPQM